MSLLHIMILSILHLESMLFELQVSEDLWSEEAEHIAGPGELVPGDNLLGDCRPAQHGPPLQHSRLHPTPGQVAIKGQCNVMKS